MQRANQGSLRVLDVVARNPGANLRQIHRLTGIPLSTVARIVERLVDTGAVNVESDRNFRRFYPVAEGIHKRERVALGLLSKPRPRAILETILKEPGIRNMDIGLELDLPAPTVTYYMKQLIAADLVVVRKEHAERHNRIKNPVMLRKALGRTTGFDPRIM